MATITVNRNELASALGFAQLGLSRRPVHPVLGGMLVTISSGTLELAAFDYEITARAKVSGQASGPGSVLVTGSELAAVVKSLPKGRKVSARVTIGDEGLVIECDGTESAVVSMGDEATGEYPAFPAMPELSGYADGAMFAASVTRAAACAGRDDTLPVLLCVQVTSDAGELVLAATDRYRLGVDRLHWTGPDGFAVSSLIPAVTLGKFAAKADRHGKIALHFGDGFAGLSDGAYTLITRTATGEFPKWRSLVRDSGADTSTVLADAAQLEAAIVRAGKLAERNEPVHLDITDDGITVRVYRDGKPAGSQAVPCVLEGDPLEIRFNAPYLAGVLGGVDGMAEIGFAGVSKPAQVTADGFTAVVMPIRPKA